MEDKLKQMGANQQQAQQMAQQHRLAGARAADDAEHLATPYLDVEVLVHHQRTEAGAQPLDPYYRLSVHLYSTR